MEPIQIKGRVASTVDLRRLGREARELEYDRLLPREIDDKLDPNGNHLIFPRPDGLPLSETSEAPVNDEGYTKVSRVDMRIHDALPCEVLAKLKGKKEATHFMLDISLENMMKLMTMDEAKAALGLYNVKNAHRRIR